MSVKPISPRVRRRLPLGGTARGWLLDVEIPMSVRNPERLLAQSHGFLVDDTAGRAIGVVDGVETDDAGHVIALVVAAGWFGRRTFRVPVDAIDALAPRERRVAVREGALPRAERRSR